MSGLSGQLSIQETSNPQKASMEKKKQLRLLMATPALSQACKLLEVLKANIRMKYKSVIEIEMRFLYLKVDKKTKE